MVSPIQAQCIFTGLMLDDKEHEIYATIQDYDEHGNTLGSYIYVDMDGELALDDTRSFVKRLVNDGIYPQCYYSGGKGFHVCVKHWVDGERSHDIIREWVCGKGSYPSLDLAVYTTHRLWRVVNTWNMKGNAFKIPLTLFELFNLTIDDIRYLARLRRKYTHNSYVEDRKSLQSEIEFIIKEKLIVKSLGRGERKTEIVKTPCITRVLLDCPCLGFRNQTIFLLARFFYAQGLSEDESIDQMLEHDHWQALEREVRSVMKSVYRRNIVRGISCINGTVSSELLRKHCDPYACKFDITLGDNVWFE